MHRSLTLRQAGFIYCVASRRVARNDHVIRRAFKKRKGRQCACPPLRSSIPSLSGSTTLADVPTISRPTNCLWPRRAARCPNAWRPFRRDNRRHSTDQLGGNKSKAPANASGKDSKADDKAKSRERKRLRENCVSS